MCSDMRMFAFVDTKTHIGSAKNSVAYQWPRPLRPLLETDGLLVSHDKANRPYYTG